MVYNGIYEWGTVFYTPGNSDFLGSFLVSLGPTWLSEEEAVRMAQVEVGENAPKEWGPPDEEYLPDGMLIGPKMAHAPVHPKDKKRYSNRGKSRFDTPEQKAKRSAAISEGHRKRRERLLSVANESDDIV